MRIPDAREEWCAKKKPELQCCRGGGKSHVWWLECYKFFHSKLSRKLSKSYASLSLVLLVVEMRPTDKSHVNGNHRRASEGELKRVCFLEVMDLQKLHIDI